MSENTAVAHPTSSELLPWTSETAHHAGHADIVREAIDGRGGNDHDELGDAEYWSSYVARVRAAADAHRNA